MSHDGKRLGVADAGDADWVEGLLWVARGFNGFFRLCPGPAPGRSGLMS
jgi:hypothetical protein